MKKTCKKFCNFFLKKFHRNIFVIAEQLVVRVQLLVGLGAPLSSRAVSAVRLVFV